jgi:hypothetical protein
MAERAKKTADNMPSTRYNSDSPYADTFNAMSDMFDSSGLGQAIRHGVIDNQRDEQVKKYRSDIDIQINRRNILYEKEENLNPIVYKKGNVNM